MALVDSSLVDLLKNIQRAHGLNISVNWSDALSEGQLKSKVWLIQTLREIGLSADLGTVFVLGGWIGVLPALMFYDEELNRGITRIRSFDLDPDCWRVAEMINRPNLIDGWRFKATTADMFKINYTEHRYLTLQTDGEVNAMVDRPDTIINTSCDHITPFSKWWDMIPDGKVVIIQNNDFEGADEDHVNTLSDLEEFKMTAPMKELYYAGELQLQKYRRFMLIGRK